jgi:hypothetical protein
VRLQSENQLKSARQKKRGGKRSEKLKVFVGSDPEWEERIKRAEREKKKKREEKIFCV